MNDEARRAFRRLYRAARTFAADLEAGAREWCAREFGRTYSPSAIDVAPAQLGIEVRLLAYAFAEGLIPARWTVAKANHFICAASTAIAERRWAELVDADAGGR